MRSIYAKCQLYEQWMWQQFNDIYVSGHITNHCPPSLDNPPYLSPRQNIKNLLGNFFGINLRSVYTKFHLSSFKTEVRSLMWQTDYIFSLLLANTCTRQKTTAVWMTTNLSHKARMKLNSHHYRILRPVYKDRDKLQGRNSMSSQIEQIQCNGQTLSLPVWQLCWPITMTPQWVESSGQKFTWMKGALAK